MQRPFTSYVSMYLQLMFFALCLTLVVIQSAFSSQVSPKELIKPFIQISQSVKFTSKDCAVRTLREAYSNIGYTLEFKITPSRRALFEADSGVTDGVTARIIGIEKDYPNLVRIDTHICMSHLHIISKKSLPIKTHNDLRHYKLGYSLGNIAEDNLVKKHQLTKSLVVVSEDSLTKMLDKGRLDIIIITNRQYKRYSDLEREKLITYTELKIKNPLYHYLNKKNKTAIKLLQAELKNLERSGFIEIAIKEHR